MSLLALSAPAATYTSGLRTLQVTSGNPALVEATSLSTGGNGRAVSADNGDLVSRVDLLALAGGAAGALASLAATLLLGEQSGDPGVVDEVDDAAEGSQEEEVEEDAVKHAVLVNFFWNASCRRWGVINLHLRVEPANRRLNNADSLVVDLASVDLASGALQHGGEVQAQVLRVHLSRERVSESLALAGGNGDAIALGGEVAEDGRDLRRARDVDRSGERAADNQDLNGLGLLVVDVEDGTGGVAVHELDAEYLCLREGGGDVDIDVGRGLGGGVLDLLLDTLDVFDLVAALALGCW